LLRPLFIIVYKHSDNVTLIAGTREQPFVPVSKNDSILKSISSRTVHTSSQILCTPFRLTAKY